MSGLRLMAWGYFKKLVIADRIALFVDPVYSSPQDYNGLSLSMATVLFAFQIFCDFSAYSDIARGTARIMGFELMINFKRPFSSGSVTEFWRRWHISLSSWFNDYLFTPLAFRFRKWKQNALIGAVLVTFFVSGILAWS